MKSLTFFPREDPDVGLLVATLATLVLFYSFGLGLYRLTFDRLAKFPGPRLAAATYWYEFYYDWWCGGKYLFQIEKMHKKYGW